MSERTCTCTPLLSSTTPAWPTTIHQYGCHAAFGTDALGHAIDKARSDEEFTERLRSSMERHGHILDRLDNGRKTPHNDGRRTDPERCDSCGKPVDVLGNCTGSCDPADEWDDQEDMW